MEETLSTTTTTTSTTTPPQPNNEAADNTSSSSPQPPPQPPPQQQVTSSSPSSSSVNPPPPPPPNPNNNIVRPNSIITSTTTTTTPPTLHHHHQSQPRPQPPTFNTRPWQQQQLSLPSSITPRVSGGGVAIGVPAPPASFASLAPPSYAAPQQSQIRQPVPGMAMTGSLGSPQPPMRPAPTPMRPPHSSLRPGTNIQPPAPQNFQGHGMLRVSTLGSPVSPSPGSSQNQPWLSSGTHGKPPLPTPSLRPQTTPQSFQQRSHVPQQHHPSLPTTTQQPINSSQIPAQSSSSTLTHDHYSQQFPPPRIQQPATHQQQITKGPASISQRPPLALPPTGALHTSAPTKTPVLPENEESSNRLITKRSIQDLLSQIDPSGKFDPEVEDILVDIAEDFVESITSFGCSLAKHRKSSTLEPKDILLHLERNWNVALPGFGGDDIKAYKKPVVSDIHRERISAIRRSTASTEPAMTNKSLGGPSSGNSKSHVAKGSVAASEAS